ncbi:N-ethylmaleimide reductase [Aquimixticola soesokkakensis]|uniref:N-ethylmaleimide reductase n=1 Tax=Aquimixticola soesokkakensis TaxID=1519096 RepID=A0A1Y5T2A9_9RHOB|nr:alkene reductase [Aquimixticola soesokkakensis]SLN54293.1 N-ethylmaleimide reductase [Aquimixticola soesokkakensis]
MSQLFTPYDLAGLTLPNRVVMAPMTRSRAMTGVPDEQTALYYAQRASAGLLITEGAPVSQEGNGYLYTPGIYTDEQEAGWAKVTKAVHDRGGRIFVQLWHVGRVSHVSLQPGAAAPVSASAQRGEGAFSFAIGPDGAPGQQPASTPRALETEEVARVTADFVAAAKRAIRAGFDGVEIHGANSYLFEQFLNAGSNQREDRYGGSIENRMRFLLETIDAVAAEIGMNRTGVRISPFGRLSGMSAFEGEAETWLAVAEALEDRQPAYVHLSDQLSIGGEAMPAGFPSQFCKTFTGTLIAAGGFTQETGEQALKDGALDLIAFGKPFIANPDLVERMQNGWPINIAPRDAFYGGTGTAGYTDFPTWDQERDETNE